MVTPTPHLPSYLEKYGMRFLNGVNAKLTFTQGLYSYQSDWKGALHWLRERLKRSAVRKDQNRTRGTCLPHSVPGM
jgi:hypothetical protein